MRAYRGDLADFAMSRGAAARWASGPEVAQQYLAARARRGRPNDPGLAPPSLRRRVAAIRGFYRFAYGDGVVDVDIAAHLELPKQPRLLPETLTIEEVGRLLDSAGGDAAVDGGGRRRSAAAALAVRNRAMLELLYAAGLRVSEALGLDLADVSLGDAWVRVVGKGDRERVVPVGDVALRWLGRLSRLAARRVARRRPASRTARRRRCSSRRAGGGLGASAPGAWSRRARTSTRLRAANLRLRPAGLERIVHVIIMHGVAEVTQDLDDEEREALHLLEDHPTEVPVGALSCVPTHKLATTASSRRPRSTRSRS